MPRGGKRAGAGRKSSWPSGCGREDTKLIRVPIALADELLEIAHRLDGGDRVHFDGMIADPAPHGPEVLDEPQTLSLLDLRPVSDGQGDIDFSDAEGPLTLRDAAELIGCASSTLQVWKSKYSPSELAKKTLNKSGDAGIALSFQNDKYYAKRIGNTI